MSPRRRSGRRKIKNNFKTLISNVTLGILSLLVFGFLSSSMKRIFFNSDIDTNYPDLSTLLTKTEYEKSTGYKIQLEIWNGCGISNLALMYTDFLRSEGLDVMDSKNADHFNYSKTTILHHRGDMSRALVLSEILKLDPINIIEDKNESLFYDLTLVIGKDYIDLPSYRNAVLFQPQF